MKAIWMRCLLAGLAAWAGCFVPFAGSAAPLRPFSVVLLDPGHGGTDNGGASRPLPGGRLLEKELSLDTARRVAKLLKAAGLRVAMTRTDDRFVDLDERVRMADRLGPGAVVVSIHYNAVGDRSVRGAETFYWHADSHGLATRIEHYLAGVVGESGRGVVRRRLRLTRNPTIPAVLAECAYLTNPREARLVADPRERERIARAIADGIVEEARFGDAGIAAVPEIWAPLSRGSDVRTVSKHSRKKRHGKHRAKAVRAGGEPRRLPSRGCLARMSHRHSPAAGEMGLPASLSLGFRSSQHVCIQLRPKTGAAPRIQPPLRRLGNGLCETFGLGEASSRLGREGEASDSCLARGPG